MGREVERINLWDFLRKYDRVQVPDIQRDYVMGSGEKISSLVDAFRSASARKQSFHFSSLLGFVEGDVFTVYDGQQRLTTLVYLLASDKNLTEDEKTLLKKFHFVGRDQANSWLIQLLEGTSSPEQCTDTIEDFTTYSLCQLWKIASNRPLEKDFLGGMVIFELVTVEKASEAEQFFMDLNDGVQLDAYEIYKAKLIYHLETMEQKDDYDPLFLKLENNWLDTFFQTFSFHKKADTILMKFLQTTFQVIGLEQGKFYEKDQVDWLTWADFQRLETVLDRVSAFLASSQKETHPNFLENLKGESFDSASLFQLISSGEHRDYDVLVWVFLVHPFSPLALLERSQKQKEDFEEFLRFLKKYLLSHRKQGKYRRIHSDNTEKSITVLPTFSFATTGKSERLVVAKCLKLEGLVEQCQGDFSAFLLALFQRKEEDFSQFHSQEFVKYTFVWNALCLSGQQTQVEALWQKWRPLMSLAQRGEVVPYSRIKEMEDLSIFKGNIAVFFSTEGKFLLDPLPKALLEERYQESELKKLLCDCSQFPEFDPWIKNVITSWTYTSGTNQECSKKFHFLPQTLEDFFQNHQNRHCALAYYRQESGLLDNSALNFLRQLVIRMAALCNDRHILLDSTYLENNPRNKATIQDIAGIIVLSPIKSSDFHRKNWRFGTLNTSYSENHVYRNHLLYDHYNGSIFVVDLLEWLRYHPYKEEFQALSDYYETLEGDLAKVLFHPDES